MRKQEFVTEYERRTDNSVAIFDRLKQQGYTMLGGGQDATVWGKDEGNVLKVLMPSENKESAEKSFLIFFNMCVSMNGNPHVPKFGANYDVFEINGTPYMQIAMERLHPIANSSAEEAIVWALSDLCTVAFIKWRDAKKEMLKPDFWDMFPFPTDSDEEMANLIDEITFNIDHFGDEDYQLLFNTMVKFFNEGRKLQLGWDLHTENVMQRKDGTLVITDPFFTS